MPRGLGITETRAAVPSFSIALCRSMRIQCMSILGPSDLQTICCKAVRREINLTNVLQVLELAKSVRPRDSCFLIATTV